MLARHLNLAAAMIVAIIAFASHTQAALVDIDTTAATASGSSNLGGFPESRAIDGNRSGNPSSNITHTAAEATDNWWEVDLGVTTWVTAVDIFNRTDCCSGRLRDITVEYYDAGGSLVGSSILLNPNNTLGGGAGNFADGPGNEGSTATPHLSYSPLTPVQARTVRIVRTATGAAGNHDANTLSLAEVEFTANNIATDSWNTASQSTTNGSFVASNAIDGALGNFTHTLSSDTSPAWTLDLKGPRPIDSVIIHNRDSCCGERLRDITIDLLAPDGSTVVATSGLLNPGNALGSPQTLTFDLHDLFADSVRTARFVRVSRTPDGAGDQGVLSIGEFQAFGLANVALGKTATQSTTLSGSFVASRAVDGVVTAVNSGSFFTHTTSTDPSPWWKVNLEGSFEIDMIVLHNRDDCCGERLSDILVEILDATGATVWTSPELNDGNTLSGPEFLSIDLIALTGGRVQGNQVRVSRIVEGGTPADSPLRVLTLGEVQVFAIQVPTPAAMPAGLALITLAAARHRRRVR